jgi:negative regulator of sigma E activity
VNSSESIPPPGLHADDDRSPRANAHKLLARRRQHTRTIRKRAIVGSVAAFVAAWAAIGVQLASGHDPALSKSSHPAAASTPSSKSKKSSAASSSSSSSSNPTSTDSTSTDSTQTTTPSASPSQQLAPVTTQQS